MDSLEASQMEEYTRLMKEAKDFAAEGELQKSLNKLLLAKKIQPTSKVLKRIEIVTAAIQNERESESDSEAEGSSDDVSNEENICPNSVQALPKDSSSNSFGSDERINLVEDFSLHHKIYNTLYSHQRQGVEWLWNLHKRRKGGILADDMGLGKTIQIIAFLSGLIDANLVKHVLIVMPVSLIENWKGEFKKWSPGISVEEFHGGTKKSREKKALEIQKKGHVLLTSYGMILNSKDALCTMYGREFIWDYFILDEGHKIKNASKTSKAVYEISALNRIVLTGTPIQNNLKEMWSLFDFAHQGTLLGTLQTFRNQYENPITRSMEKDATAGEKRLGSQISENLKDLIKPYFLRRTKAEVWREGPSKEMVELENQMEAMTISMPKKNELILWTFLSEQQIDIYKRFLHSNAVKEILMTKRSPLVELNVLKKICDHPRLLSRRACSKLGLDGELLNDSLEDESAMNPSIDFVSDDTLLLESGKLKLVITLLEHLKEKGHRTLFFSLSRKILDMVQRILTNKDFKVLRLDGTVTKMEDRARLIKTFQKNSSYPVFLLTTQVGGVGLTLTAADRVVIYDPSWNPATDAQAVDRIFRIGQDKNVVVYRLITCGTVEEKIYRRQIFKDSITRQATGDTDPHRYFSKQELRDLFTFEEPHYSSTQVQLHEMHSSERKTDPMLTRHIEFLSSLNIFGVSDHDLMFTGDPIDCSEDTDAAAVSENFIQQQVATARDRISKEAQAIGEIADSYKRSYPLPVNPTRKGKVFLKPPLISQSIPESDSESDSDVQELSDTSLDSEEDIYIEEDSRVVPDQKTDVIDVEDDKASLKKQPSANMLSESDEDSSDAASVLFVPVSNYSTPQPCTSRRKSDGSTIFETPPTAVKRTSNRLDLHLKGVLDSIRSSTPLKIDKSLKKDEETTFVSTRPLLQPSPKKNKDGEEENSIVFVEDSPTLAGTASRHTLLDLDNEKKSNRSAGSETPPTPKGTSSQFDLHLKECGEDSTKRIPPLKIEVSLLEELEEAMAPSPIVTLHKRGQDGEENSIVSLGESPILPGMGSVEEVNQRGISMNQGNRIAPELNSSLKHEGSIRRITPLKVDRNFTQENTSFAEAMANSLIITPPSVDKNEQDISVDMEESLIFAKKKKQIYVLSDSEESDDEMQISKSSGDPCENPKLDIFAKFEATEEKTVSDKSSAQKIFSVEGATSPVASHEGDQSIAEEGSPAVPVVHRKKPHRRILSHPEESDDDDDDGVFAELSKLSGVKSAVDDSRSSINLSFEAEEESHLKEKSANASNSLFSESAEETEESAEETEESEEEDLSDVLDD